MKSGVIFFKVLAISVLLAFVACSQNNAGDPEFTIEGSSETENPENKVSLNAGATAGMSEQARIENYAKVAKLDSEATWKQWREYKESLDAAVKLDLEAFTYNTANLAALAKFFILTDKNVGFTFKALFRKPVNLFIVAQYTFYTFKDATQQQASFARQSQDEQVSGLRDDSNQRTIRGASTRFQGSIETFSNALAIFNRLLVADYQSVGLSVTGIDSTASGSREFATFNTKLLDATAIESKLPGTEYSFAQFLNQQLEFVFSSSMVVANNIEYTFVSYPSSSFTFATNISVEKEFAPREVLDFAKNIKVDAKSQRATIHQQKNTANINTQAKTEQIEPTRYQNNTQAAEVIEIENQVRANAVTNQEAQMLLNATSNDLSFSKDLHQTVDMNQDNRINLNQRTVNQQDRQKIIFRNDSTGVIKADHYEQEFHADTVDSERKSDDDGDDDID